jgi:hypothetical protein
MAKQVTLKATKDRIAKVAADEVEDRLRHIASYAVTVSPVDTGAYVESFSLLRAGSGGGRSKSSDARANGVKKGTGGANPESFRDVARQNLSGDIEALNVEEMIQSENPRVTLRNRAPHAKSVEDGTDWQHHDGYYVFTKIRNRFG